MILREYGVSNKLSRRIGRKIIPHFSKRMMHFEIDRPVVSISFDDFPKSVMEKALPALDKYGWKASFYVAAGLENITNHLGLHFNRDDLKQLQREGHEIGCHTYHHLNVTELSDRRKIEQIRSNAKAMKSLGFDEKMRTFAYPFGEASLTCKKQLESSFDSMRGIMRGIHYGKVDLNQVKSVPIYTGSTMQQTLGFIDSLQKKPGWLTLFTHDIRKNPSEWGCTLEDFEYTLETIHNSGAIVLPIQQAIDFLRTSKSTDLAHAKGVRKHDME